MPRPAIIVRSLAEARAALAAAAALGRPVTLLSPPGAAGYAGPMYFGEMIAAARAEFPHAEIEAILDCGDAPGHVLGALRYGLKTLRFTGPHAAAAKLAEIAAASGARLIAGEIPALDLHGRDNAEAVCRAWLADGAHG
ncbi:MAG: hypothetical protein HY057_10295 [Rhodospirillales bacterium]|nr:hypothetical protein [Rhodospirillales bacterium]